MNKIKSPEETLLDVGQALAWRQGLSDDRRTLAVTNGCFDILHRGHVEYLNRARELADCLLVLLNSDISVRALKGPSRPVNCQSDRAFVLAALRCVDAVLIFEEPRCTKLFTLLRPDVYVKGGDYNIDTINSEEKAALLGVNAQIRFIPLVPGFSTTSLLDEVKQK